MSGWERMSHTNARFCCARQPGIHPGGPLGIPVIGSDYKGHYPGNGQKGSEYKNTITFPGFQMRTGKSLGY